MSRNRYGVEYWFENCGNKIFKVCGELSYWRFGGQEYKEGIDYQNLGFADPSGGPFLAPGATIGEVGRIKRIFLDNDQVMLELE